MVDKKKPTEKKTEVPEKVVLNKAAFNKRNKYEKREADVEVPELNELMGLKKGQTAIIRVGQMNLDTFLSARNEITNEVTNLIDGIVAAAKSGVDNVEDKVKEAWDKRSPDVKYRIEMVHKSLVSPKLNKSDIIWIADVFPLVLMRLANRITQLTEIGGDLKKKSQG